MVWTFPLIFLTLPTPWVIIYHSTAKQKRMNASLATKSLIVIEIMLLSMKLLFPCTVSESVFGRFSIQIESDFHMALEWQLQHRTIAQNGIQGKATSCLCSSRKTMILCYCSCQRTVPIFKVITQYRLTKYATILNQILIFVWVVLLEVTFYLNPVINTLICILLRLMYSKWIDQEDIKTQSHPEYYSLGFTPYGSLLI